VGWFSLNAALQSEGDGRGFHFRDWAEESEQKCQLAVAIETGVRVEGERLRLIFNF